MEVMGCDNRKLEKAPAAHPYIFLVLDTYLYRFLTDTFWTYLTVFVNVFQLSKNPIKTMEVLTSLDHFVKFSYEFC